MNAFVVLSIHGVEKEGTNNTILDSTHTEKAARTILDSIQGAQGDS